jgi:SAM-dependent methyltransferase
MPDGDLLRGGDYARKQIFCPSRVVAWSHGSRFARARALVRPRAGGRLLDYGCGDGTFIALAHDAFVAVRTRLGILPGVSFSLVRDVEPRDGPWDAVTCMEVLEHCVEDERCRVLDELVRLAAPGGVIVISVPIEIGPSLAGKQLFRALAGWRRLGDYQHRERYGIVELARGIAGMTLQRAAYEGDGPGGRYRYYGHKGFDYRRLEAEIRERMRIVRRLFTPMPWLGPGMNSQVWFVCERDGRSA